MMNMFSGKKWLLLNVVYLSLISYSRMSEDVNSEPMDVSTVDVPILSVWFKNEFFKCSASIHEFLQCCNNSRCTSDQLSIYECCTGSHASRSISDARPACTNQISEFVKQQCSMSGREFCPYDGEDFKSCCARPPCNIRLMKERHCCSK